MEKNKNKKRDDIKVNREFIALFFALATFFSAYTFIAPNKFGMFGKVFCSVMFSVFGAASYILPFIFLRYCIIYIGQFLEVKKRINFIWSIACLVSFSASFSYICFIFKSKVFGGWLGDNLCLFFREIFGIWLGFVVVIIIFLTFVTKFFRISLGNIVSNILNASSKKFKEEAVKYKEKNPQDNAYKKNNDESIVQHRFDSKFHERKSIVPNILFKHKDEENKKEVSVMRMVKQKMIDSRDFEYNLPNTDLLKNDVTSDFITNKNELLERAELLRKTLIDFDISAEVKDIIPGPIVTRYDLVLAPGVRIQAVFNIVDNISLAMRTASIRIVPIPEKAVVGIEVPNLSSIIVGLRGIIETRSFENSCSLLTLALGKTTDGLGYITNLTSMPHLLIAGATGSGKSVGIHTIILSILYKARPDEVKFVLIDPKRVEMPVYKDIPHIYNPCVSAINADIITTAKEASAVLKKLVTVMEERYTKFAKAMVRNIEDYNNKITEIGGKKEFYIVVIIDELADLMLAVQKEIEDSIQRLAQMSRAVGIHLVLATQRPSVNVITGIIKANFPARLSFQTTSKIDSRVILDMLGAESLMGNGDMLFLPPGEGRAIRLQGAYVSLKEAEKVISFINNQNFPRIYESMAIEVDSNDGFDADKEKRIKDLVPALKLINERRRVSQDLLKANFGSSARATNILSILEIEGFILKPEGTNRWNINFNKIVQYLDNVDCEK